MEAWAAYCEQTTGNVVQTSYASMTGRFSRLRHPADRKLWSFARSLAAKRISAPCALKASQGRPLRSAARQRPKRIPLVRKAIRLLKQTIWPWCMGLDGWQTGGDPDYYSRPSSLSSWSVCNHSPSPVRRTAVLFSKVAGACPDCLTPKG
jgi:hypothetical protein